MVTGAARNTTPIMCVVSGKFNAGRPSGRAKPDKTMVQRKNTDIEMKIQAHTTSSQQSLRSGRRTREFTAGMTVPGVLLLLALAAAGGCSKEPDGLSGQKDPNEIVSTVTFSADASTDPGAWTSAAAGPHTRAVADPAAAMTLHFVRADQNVSGEYPAYGTTEFTATRAAGTGAQALSFNPKQYYVFPPNDDQHTKMVGWYPAATTFSGGVVSWTIDGSQDVMTAPMCEGSSRNPVMAFAFGHRLAQLQFYPYAEDAAASAAWGKVTAIAVEKQSATLTFTPASDEATGAVVATDAAGNDFTAKNLAQAVLPTSADTRFGDPVMIFPQADGYYLRVKVTTELGGIVSALAPARTYAAGSVTRLKLKFTRSTIRVEPEAWIDQDGTADTGGYPYSADGKIIVSKDAFGGADAATLLTDTQQAYVYGNITSATYSETSEYNKVSTRLQVAAEDAPSKLSWSEAYTFCRAYSEAGAPVGTWRLPSLAELQLIYSVRAQLTGTFQSANYWSAPEASWDTRVALGVKFDTGGRHNDDKSVADWVRCVRCPEFSRKTYPYIVGGTVIVSQDDEGRVADPTTLLTAGQLNYVNSDITMNLYDQNSEYNKVSSRLQVSRENANNGAASDWPTAYTACKTTYAEEGAPAGTWRLPTIRESKLIAAQKDLLDLPAALNATYWSSTTRSSIDDEALWFFCNPWEQAADPKDNAICLVRCVRDVTSDELTPYFSIPLYYGDAGNNGAVTTDLSGSTENSYNAYVIGSNGSYYRTQVDVYAGEMPYAKLQVAMTDEVFTDFNGKRTWQIAMQTCRNKTTDGGGWRLPRFSEMRLLFNNLAAVNAALTAGGGTKLLSSYYWSATEASATEIWTTDTRTLSNFKIVAKANNDANIRCVREVK